MNDTNYVKLETSLSTRLSVKKRLTYQIPDQDEISKKKDRIWKFEMGACGLIVALLLTALWIYNVHHPLVQFEFKSISRLELPVLTLCLPITLPIDRSNHYFSFREFNLTHVTRPGQFNLADHLKEHCSSFNFDSKSENSCFDFIEYDGFCLHIGLNDKFPWSLKTEGQTMLSLILVYRSAVERSRNLILPFFGWNSTCHGGQENEDCTLKDDQHLGVQDLERNSPFVLYQLATNQMLLADINEEHHISADGIKSTLYPTSFVGFPFDVRSDFGDLCRDVTGEFDEPCRVIYLGLRSLTRIVKYTREEDGLSIAIKSISSTTSQLGLITGLMALFFGYLITRLTIFNPSGYLDHDLREAVLFLIKENEQNKSKV